jgi:hypothetical protein
MANAAPSKAELHRVTEQPPFERIGWQPPISSSSFLTNCAKMKT